MEQNNKKPKNIILCADGTGNEGGYTPDSNVYKTYKAIDIHDEDLEQIVFYDNGVGTQTNKYIRGLSGGLGFGFKRNISDLYEFLARHYNQGDNIYMYGFSRGAATIRAFNGFIYAVGLIDGREYGNKDLKDHVKKAMKAYTTINRGADNKADPKKKEKLLSGVKMHDNTPEITFIGVWDTVAALGFPRKVNITGVLLWVTLFLFKILGDLYDLIDSFKFYNYEATPNVKKICHAISIDDERTTFMPLVYKENIDDAARVNIKQVWFAGAHSNIGGGYERAELANVSLEWMFLNAPGLKIEPNTLPTAKADANVNGRLYNSRDGLAAFFRYSPRRMKELCDKAGAEVYVHDTVIERIMRRTANYAPVALPQEFKIVKNNDDVVQSVKVDDVLWNKYNKRVRSFITTRKWLYAIILEVILAIAIYAFVIWPRSTQLSQHITPQGFSKYLLDIIEFATPKMLEPFFHHLVLDVPWYTLGVVVFLIIFYIILKYSRTQTTRKAESLRRLFIHPPDGDQKKPKWELFEVKS